jgi:hypothetical protein
MGLGHRRFLHRDAPARRRSEGGGVGGKARGQGRKRDADGVSGWRRMYSSLIKLKSTNNTSTYKGGV